MSRLLIPVLPSSISLKEEEIILPIWIIVSIRRQFQLKGRVLTVVCRMVVVVAKWPTKRVNLQVPIVRESLSETSGKVSPARRSRRKPDTYLFFQRSPAWNLTAEPHNVNTTMKTNLWIANYGKDHSPKPVTFMYQVKLNSCCFIHCNSFFKNHTLLCYISSGIL